MENPKKQGELCVVCVLWGSLIQYPVSPSCLHHTNGEIESCNRIWSTVVFGGYLCRLKNNEVQASIYRWPSLFGGLDSGLDCGTGLRDWTHRKLCASNFEAAHTLLHYSILTSHELNSGQTAITRYQYRQDQTKFQQPFLQMCMLYKCVPACKPNNHWPLSNGNTVNLQSRTLILSSKQSLPSGKSTHVCLRQCRSQTESG